MKRKREGKGLTIEEQMDLFVNQVKKEAEEKKQSEEQAAIQKSGQLLKSLIKPAPEQNHTCSTQICNPLNEQYFIDRRLIPGPPIHPSVYMCKYGRLHVCELQYKECIIVADMFTNCSCQISGRYYGQSAGLPSFHSPSKLSVHYEPDPKEELELDGDDMDDKVSLKQEDENESNFGFDMEHNDDDYDDGFGDDINDNDPFMTMTNNIRDFHVPNSKFVEKVTIAPTIKSKKDTIAPVTLVMVKKDKTIYETEKPKKFELPAHETSIQHFTTFAMNQNGKRGGGMQIVDNSKSTIIKKKTRRTRQNKKYTIFNEPNFENNPWKTDCIALIQKLFYSNLRKDIGKRQFDNCLTNAQKVLTNDIRYIKEKRELGQKISIHYYKLFLNFYGCVTVNHIQVNVAPTNSDFISRTTQVILMQWQILITSPLCNNIGTGKLNFVNHALAVLYEMRKSGLVLYNEQIIPKCEYTRTYMPPIELIEQFGFKKSHITNGLKLLQNAHQSIVEMNSQSVPKAFL